MSDAAGNASIYVLVNIVEVEECNEAVSCTKSFSLYNTNIVFNRYGCIISRYRKFNLFREKSMTTPEHARMEIFTTDFGVTFGHFICFDILFKSPAYDMVLSNITHIIFPSMWYSQFPFLTSLQLQQNFAYRNNIVLLASGANSPSFGSTGSGIFIGKHGPAQSILSCQNETKLIISKVPKDINDDTYIPDYPTIESCTTAEMDKLETWSFNPQNIHPLKEHFHFSDENIDCEFTINFTKLSIDTDENIGYSYKLAAFNGIRSLSNVVNAGEIYCAIIPCMNDDIETCGRRFENNEKLVPSIRFHSIKIIAKVRKEDDSLVMPTTLDFSLLPLGVDKFIFMNFESDDRQIYEINSDNEYSNLLTFGIHGRNYTADNKNFELTTIVSTTLEATDGYSTKPTDDLEMAVVSEEGSNQLFGWILYGMLMTVLCVVAAVLVYRRLQDPYQHPLVVMRRKSEMNMV